MPIAVSRLTEAVRRGAIPGRHHHGFGGPALLLAVFALLVQSLLVQTHVHLPWLERASLPHSAHTSALADRGDPGHRVPAHGDADHCPLWQAMIHAGTFTVPVLDLPPVLPMPWPARVEVTLAIVAIYAVSHSWQGRAPPLPRYFPVVTPGA